MHAPVKLYLASSNPGKLDEFRALADWALQFSSTTFVDQVANDLLDHKPPTTSSTIALAGKQVPVAAVRVEVITPDTVKSLLVDSGFLTADEVPACKAHLAAVP